MIKRRKFLQLAAVSTGTIVLGRLPGISGPVKQNSTPQTALIFDAMGEIRDIYTPELIKKILSSGLDAIAVTLCDPKTFEHEATEVANEGILLYDNYIRSNPDLFIKATCISDIDRAKGEGKLAIFYLCFVSCY